MRLLEMNEPIASVKDLCELINELKTETEFECFSKHCRARKATIQKFIVTEEKYMQEEYYTRRCFYCKTDQSATAHTIFHGLTDLNALALSRMMHFHFNYGREEYSRLTDQDYLRAFVKYSKTSLGRKEPVRTTIEGMTLEGFQDMRKRIQVCQLFLNNVNAVLEPNRPLLVAAFKLRNQKEEGYVYLGIQNKESGFLKAKAYLNLNLEALSDFVDGLHGLDCVLLVEWPVKIEMGKVESYAAMPKIFRNNEYWVFNSVDCPEVFRDGGISMVQRELSVLFDWVGEINPSETLDELNEHLMEYLTPYHNLNVSYNKIFLYGVLLGQLFFASEYRTNKLMERLSAAKGFKHYSASNVHEKLVMPALAKMLFDFEKNLNRPD